MNKFRGTRGVRDFSREAQELIKPALVLAAGLLVVPWLAAHETVPAVVVFAEQEVFFLPPYTPHNSSRYFSIVPLSHEYEVFFDTYSQKIIFPRELNATVENVYYRRRYAVSFYGANFPRTFAPLGHYEILTTHIWREGNSFTLYNRRGVFYERGENENFSYIRIIDPRERYHTIVIIDAGHGGRDPGAPNVNGGPWEAEIVLAISHKLLEIFDEPGVLLLPTRTGDYYIPVASRARIANAIGDYFISIHCNADARSRLSRGTLTLHGTAQGSYELAQKFQYALHNALSVQDRGIHYAPQFRILRDSQIPVALLELLFLSNPYDAARLADPATQMQIAQVLADTISNLPRVR
jgi:N-acetylmuramoyl-L-alanine amidase